MTHRLCERKGGSGGFSEVTRVHECRPLIAPPAVSENQLQPWPAGPALRWFAVAKPGALVVFPTTTERGASRLVKGVCVRGVQLW